MRSFGMERLFSLRHRLWKSRIRRSATSDGRAGCAALRAVCRQRTSTAFPRGQPRPEPEDVAFLPYLALEWQRSYAAPSRDRRTDRAPIGFVGVGRVRPRQRRASQAADFPAVARRRPLSERGIGTELIERWPRAAPSTPAHRAPPIHRHDPWRTTVPAHRLIHRPGPPGALRFRRRRRDASMNATLGAISTRVVPVEPRRP